MSHHGERFVHTTKCPVCMSSDFKVHVKNEHGFWKYAEGYCLGNDGPNCEKALTNKNKQGLLTEAVLGREDGLRR